MKPSIAGWVLALIAWCSFAPQAICQDPLMQFLFSDGSSIEGNLTVSDLPDHVAIRSPLFAQPLVIPVARLVEAVQLQDADAAEIESSVDEVVPGSALSLAIRLDNQDQYVGRVVSVDDGMIELESDDLGSLRLSADRIRGVVAAAAAPRMMRNLIQSQHRLKGEPGWLVQDQVLVGQTPESAVVLAWDLPDRFQLHLEVTCEGEPDFEMALGDHSVSGAGQGGQRVDRRGGSLSRTPSERFVTRMEWIGRSVSVVRSNASVSDSDVFDLSNAGNRLQLDLFIDQASGRMTAYRNGLQVGDVAIKDDEPVLRRELTLITRGDPVTVEQLEWLQWAGDLPVSQWLPNQFTLLRDGTVVKDVIQQWAGDQFMVDGVWRPYSELLRMESGVHGFVDSGIQWVLRDGSRVRGRIIAEADAAGDQGTGTAGRIRLLDSLGTTLGVDVASVTAVNAGDAIQWITPSDQHAVLHSDRTQIWGQLRSNHSSNAALDGSTAQPFAWQSLIGVAPTDIVAAEEMMIEWMSADSAADANGEAVETPSPECQLEFHQGDRLPGELIAIDRDVIRFRSESCGEVAVASRQVRRVRLQSTMVQVGVDRDYLLALPRRMNESPPTHVLVSTNGDALRGRLLAIDNSTARIEVRGAVRVIDRAAIAEVIWIATEQPDPAEQPDPDVCRYVISTREGAMLGMESARLEDAQIIAAHHVLGVCRFPIADIRRLRFGTREQVQQESWDLVPVKEPKNFE